MNPFLQRIDNLAIGSEMLKHRLRFLFVGVCLGTITILAGCKPATTSADAGLAAIPSTTGQIATIIDPKTAAAAPALTRHPIRFTDMSKAAGLTWTYQNGATGEHLFIETTGGGVGLLDYNGDGLLDIFALQGGPVPGAKPSQSHFSTRSVLYRNNGDGTFTDVTAGSGLDVNLGYGQAVSVADYDNDGRPDLYVTAYGGNHLFHNNGDGTFTDVTAKAGVADVGKKGLENPWPLSAAWADYDNDGKLDLFVCHYCRWSPALSKECRNPAGQLAYCRPQVFEPSQCRLYHNNGDGTFTDVTQKTGIAKLLGKSMGATWIDYDDDGWMDLFVTNDTMVNFLLHNNRDGTFTDQAIMAGVAYGEQGAASSGMGIGIGDYDNDGREDIFVVNFSGQPKSAFHNMGQGLFESASSQTRLASTNLQFLAFGLECLDYDLDGYKDLIVGNGHVLDARDALNNSSTYEESQQLFHNQRDGTFTEDMRSLGDLVLPRVTRGLAIGDMDNDGDIDVVMVSQTGPLQWYRNEGGNENHWITLRLEGVRCNRDGIGAKVRIHTASGWQTQWLRSGSSYISHSDMRLTFGLGENTGIIEGSIRWPNGHTQTFGSLVANTFYLAREGAVPAADPRIKRP